MTYDPNPPERPRSEPEIIPPDRDGGRFGWRRSPSPSYGFEETRSSRVYVAKLGPLGGVLLLLAIAAIVAIVMIAVLGAVLVWIPIVALVVIVGALFRLFRG